MRYMTYHRINRNIVECKLIFISNLGNDSDGINRNIVECKYMTDSIGDGLSNGINRNIVECKFIYELIVNDGEKFELIETLWNVN